MANNKSWWAPVWRGLVVDPDAKHYRRMKNAVWLFLHLILHADRRSGRLKRKCKTIASEMGVPKKTIHRWLKTLRDRGYIETRSTGHCLEIEIKLWKNARIGSQMAGANGPAWPARTDGREESQTDRDWRKLLMR